MTAQTQAYAAEDKDAPLRPLTIERRDVGPRDVAIDIEFCGICHSDIHFARNDWGNATYPAVPGHEIVGTVTEVGAEVTGFSAGQRVGVGCLVDSCGRCGACEDQEEQYCENGWTGTYGSKDPILGGPTFGGYSKRIVVKDDFVLRVPGVLDPKGVAPLLCAGITTYSPLKHWKVGPGQRVGVIGLGGLGHMGVKFAAAMGAHVVMLTTSPEKAQDAERLGAKEVLVTTDKAQVKAAKGSFDLLLNTVPVAHELNGYVDLLSRNGTMVIVGAIEPFDGVHTGGLIMGRKRIAGSLIGGIAETQEMLDFCAEHGIVSDVEMTSMEAVNEAWERVVKGDVKYRFVIDMATL
jgi:uncharacterized zinc-type alcohol dehydrogenase-like protein